MTKCHQFITSCITLSIAIILTGFGVALFVHANLGSDTITVFLDGLRKVASISLGDASRMYNISALIIVCCIAYKHIGWTSVIYALSTGFFIDYFDMLLTGFQFSQQGFLIRIYFVIVGQLCIIVAFALLVRYGSGMDQLDAIAYGVDYHTHISYAKIRTLLDVIMIVSGFLMGGVIGIGSILAMVTTGYGVDLFIKYVFKQDSKNLM